MKEVLQEIWLAMQRDPEFRLLVYLVLAFFLCLFWGIIIYLFVQ
jgi:hypothetical protein